MVLQRFSGLKLKSTAHKGPKSILPRFIAKDEGKMKGRVSPDNLSVAKVIHRTCLVVVYTPADLLWI